MVNHPSDRDACPVYQVYPELRGEGGAWRRRTSLESAEAFITRIGEPVNGSVSDCAFTLWP